jgi:2,3-dihydroxyphenylpropionate 1,2-dioxygenase
MGEIVAACSTCHTPYLFTRPPDENPAQLDAAGAAMRELGRMLDETEPDVVIVLGSDHLETFSVTCVPTFAIIAGSYANAEFAGKRFAPPVHREMAEDLLSKLIARDFDIAYSEDAELGHAFAVPFEYILGERKIPVIPFFTNVYIPPLPTAKRCAALGRAIADIIRSRNERVAIVASGGMSHFPGTTKYLHPEFDFDRWLIAQLEAGNTDALLNMTNEQLDEVGNTELLTWATLFGAIGPRQGELIDYLPTWHHGLCMMRFLPARERKTPAMSALQDRGGFEFQNKGFQFYRHPPAEAYGLNRLLFEVRHSADLRQRIIDNLDAVAAEYHLNPAQRQGAQSLINVGTGGLVSEHVAPLVEAGAHPLQALMSLHVIYSMSHRTRKATSAQTP